MLTHIQHVAILTSNIDEAMDHYVELLGCERPAVIDVDKVGVKLRTVMLPIGTDGRTFLQIIEPRQGPGVEELARGGEGTLFEVGFEVDDIEALHDCLAEKDIKPRDLAGNPISGKYIESRYGNRYFILPKDKTRGTRTEVVQVRIGPDRS